MFKKYFNSETIGWRNRLSTLSQELMGKHGDLTPEGLREFVQRAEELVHVSIYPRNMMKWFKEAGFITEEEYQTLWDGDVLHENITEKELLDIYSKVCRQFKELKIVGKQVVYTYEDSMIYTLYNVINDKALDVREHQKHLTAEYDNYFTHLLRCMGVEKALDAIWSDIASFYPGVQIFTIRRTL